MNNNVVSKEMLENKDISYFDYQLFGRNYDADAHRHQLLPVPPQP